MAVSELKKISISSESYNSNNGWGFGGKSGTRYYFIVGDDTTYMEIGKYSYRHLPSSPQKSYRLKGANVDLEMFQDYFENHHEAKE